ncbi:hypothetical protein Tco_1085320 [Tanacetum coccineum]
MRIDFTDLGVLGLAYLHCSWFSLLVDLEDLGVLRVYLVSLFADLAELGVLEIIVLLDSLDDSKGVSNKGPTIPRVPVEGPSIQYGYDTVEEYLEETFFPSTDKDTTDKASTDKDTIHESYSPKSKAKYVPVSQKHNPMSSSKALLQSQDVCLD